MSSIRWEPIGELNTIQSEMNRLLNTFIEGTPSGNGSAAARRWIPAMDLVETGDGFVLRADLPGLSEDDVKIEVDSGVLTVSGERKAEQEQREQDYVCLE